MKMVCSELKILSLLYVYIYILFIDLIQLCYIFILYECLSGRYGK